MFAINAKLNLSNKSSCYINVAESASGQAEANPGRFPFSQNFRNFRFDGKWNTFRGFVPLENSQKKWKI